MRTLTCLIVGSLAAVTFAMFAGGLTGHDRSPAKLSSDGTDVAAKRGHGKAAPEALPSRSRSRLVRNATGRPRPAGKGGVASTSNAGLRDSQAQSGPGAVWASPPGGSPPLCTLQSSQIRLQV
jgi:hypothetical protein